jgi:DNA-binding response OmpR family regulator
MASTASALVASSQQDHLREWVTALAHHGVEARPCSDLMALELALSGAKGLDALLLDLPFDGEDSPGVLDRLLRQIRQRPGIVTVLHDSLRHELVNALEAGVDVPLLGPVRPNEVAAAVVRVVSPRGIRADEQDAWELDPVTWTLRAPATDVRVPLTYKEREFLIMLGRQPGDPMAKEAFAEIFGTSRELFDPRRLEIMVRRLRNKLQQKAGVDLPVRTAHGVGYAFGGAIRLLDTPAVD